LANIVFSVIYVAMASHSPRSMPLSDFKGHAEMCNAKMWHGMGILHLEGEKEKEKW
jgi:hypothetical protein